MANLNFTFDETEGVYYSEFTVTEDYHLHIEVAEDAKRGMRVLRKGRASDRYALAYENFPPTALQESEIFDGFHTGGIYPLMFRIETMAIPTVAYYNYAE